MKREGIAILDPLGSHGGFHYYTDGLAEGVAHAGRRVVLYGCDLAARRRFESTLTWAPVLQAYEGLCRAS